MTDSYHNTLPIGTRIESYEIKDILGVGGFGVTYKGWDHDLHCFVAIKEYLPEGLAIRTEDSTTVVPRSENDKPHYKHGLKRFIEEARILAKFKERSIARVTRFLEANGTGYFLMDYEEGESLAQLLKRCGILSEKEVYSILIPILQGLCVVHAEGIMHRDIKPANIFLRNDGSPVLLDFGAARQALGAETVAFTQIVTPGYGPFEQYGSTDRQGPWTDLYALGATLYHCIAGKAPPKAPDRIAALQDRAADPIKPAVEIGAGRYNHTLLTLIDRLLLPNAKDRPQSAEVALATLQQQEQHDEEATQIQPETEEQKTILLEKTVMLAPTENLPTTKDQTEEFKQCMKLAEKGKVNAQFELGIRFAHGRGVEQDESAASEWLTKAAEAGYTLAQSRFGMMLARGAGVKKDAVTAAKWLRKAAEKGDVSSQFNYGMLCAHGIGVPQDTELAIEWYSKAASKGHEGALANLEVVSAKQSIWQRWGIAAIIVTLVIASVIGWQFLQ